MKPRRTRRAPLLNPIQASRPKKTRKWKREKEKAFEKAGQGDYEFLLEFDETFRKLSYRLHASLRGAEVWDEEDLLQEAYLRSIISLEGFAGQSSLKHYLVRNFRNIVIQKARKACRRPRPSGDAISRRKSPERDPHERLVLRADTKGLLDWLKQNPDEVAGGWEVLTLLLKNHADFSYVATAMSIHTGDSWTTERVRNVIRKIRKTEQGQELCLALTLETETERN